MTDVLTFGETMLALRGTRTGRLAQGHEFEAAVAGAESTVAIGLARLGHRVEWLGHVGVDEAGAVVRAAVQGEGVRVSGRVDPGRPTGLLLRTDRTAAVGRVTYYRAGSAAAALAPADLDEALDRAPRVVHATGITAAISDSARAAVLHAARRAKQCGCLVSFDVNLRSRLTGVPVAGVVLAELLPHVDLLLCGEDELPVLAAALGRPSLTVEEALASGAVPELVLTRGVRGAAAAVGGERFDTAAVPVTPVDTVGAGDAFAAGYLSALLDSEPPQARLARGAVLGAFCVSARGDWENLPTRAELELFDGDGRTDR
jgi:2-dehydro-3-deoxygluconokinase